MLPSPPGRAAAWRRTPAPRLSGASCAEPQRPLAPAPRTWTTFSASLPEIAAHSPAGRRIEPGRGNLRHGRLPNWIAAIPPWHLDAVGGRLQHQRHREAIRRSSVRSAEAANPPGEDLRAGRVEPWTAKSTDQPSLDRSSRLATKPSACGLEPDGRQPALPQRLIAAFPVGPRAPRLRRSAHAYRLACWSHKMNPPESAQQRPKAPPNPACIAGHVRVRIPCLAQPPPPRRGRTIAGKGMDLGDLRCRAL